MKKIIVLAIAVLAMAGTAMAAGNANVGASGTVIASCGFTTAGSVAFGNLDPASGAAATGSVTQPTWWCTNGTTAAITDDDGLQESGVNGNRMIKGAGEWIPYSFTYTASGSGLGKGNPIAMDIAASIANADYINAPVGAYTDTVVLTINP